MNRSDWPQAALAVVALATVAWMSYNSRPKCSAANSIADLIGETPVLRLNHLSQLTECEIYTKLELANPGGSAKDRIALSIIKAAERAGDLRPGHRDCVFEGTSGSTGISIALVCRSRGYEAHIVVPDDISKDKLELLKMLGANVHIVRPASIADEGHYVNVARKLANEANSESRRAIFANQFENDANWRAHYTSTGPEILKQVPGIDCFVTGSGTGGTIAGVSRYLKSKKSVRIVLADIQGSGLYNKVHYGVMYNTTEREGHRRRHQIDSVVEGIGLNRITHNFSQAVIDDAEAVSDVDARYMASYLVEHEGLFVGSSSAVNCVAAFRHARKLGRGHRIVFISCDSGTRHLSKFWAMPLENCDVAQELREAESDHNKCI